MAEGRRGDPTVQLAQRARKLTEQARHATVERDQLVVELYRHGRGVREIGRLVGMSAPNVLHIVRRDYLNGMEAAGAVEAIAAGVRRR